MSQIWVISETQSALLELVAHAKGIAQGESIVAWAFSTEAAQAASKQGADQVIELTGAKRPEDYTSAMIERAQSEIPIAILWGSTRRSKEMAARLAAALDAGLINETFNLKREGQSFRAERYIYGGLCVAREVMETAPFMAIMVAKTAEALDEGAACHIETLTNSETKIQMIELRPNLATSNLGDANVVVCVGRGIIKSEDIELARRLASKLGGELGCTRPVAEDLHWMPEENYIGISGQMVKPTVYIGIGVSGQIQHVSGIRDSKTIIAIEKNENAPIIEAADYALVGDLYQILPALLSSLGA
ncbi:electron transfer flavoprotein subunit alpha/FixB family protein [Desulfitobacterium sp.]|uniref:electron transfer flavoprotein subunit alpha/FixB family protein n=1 Tax=Desulfitobacterium sp. TaxID=49981 RepID=UPI002CAB8CAA|nr:electron transfer flavoprotein subunit alpha/FixB family protein [Desulfitobacterium sp.]HVJ49924.1 electron transfer flavoprotein subunit alpha/FixB family protein [Desulfitobacterium sp.]